MCLRGLFPEVFFNSHDFKEDSEIRLLNNDMLEYF